MPFDGLKLDNSLECRCLQQHLSSLGLHGIDPTVLTAHKQREIDRHPADLLYKHHKAVVRLLAATFQLAFGLAALTMLFNIVAIVSNLSSPGFYAFLILLAIMVGVVIISEYVHVRGPAEWHVRRIGQREMESVCPPAVVVMARRIKQHLWQFHNHRTAFLYGELRQDDILLDPYLTICDEQTGEEIILAIWDGETILHSAG